MINLYIQMRIFSLLCKKRESGDIVTIYAFIIPKQSEHFEIPPK